MSNSLNYNIDDIFPDLFPEDPMIDNVISAEPPQLLVPSYEIKTINDRLENLELTANTNSLQIRVERMKRQKLRSSLRQFRHDASTLSADIASLKQTIMLSNDQQNTINYQFGGELDRSSTMTFRSLSRMQYLLAAIISRVTSSPEDYDNLAQHLDEICRTIQHFRVNHQVSYV